MACYDSHAWEISVDFGAENSHFIGRFGIIYQVQTSNKGIDAGFTGETAARLHDVRRTAMGTRRDNDQTIGGKKGQRQFVREIIGMFISAVLCKKKTVGIRTRTGIDTTNNGSYARSNPHAVVDKGKTADEIV